MGMTVKLNPKQKEILSDKLMDLANIAVGSLVFGVIVRSEAFSYLSVLLGLVIASAAYIFAVKLEK